MNKKKICIISIFLLLIISALIYIWPLPMHLEMPICTADGKKTAQLVFSGTWYRRSGGRRVLEGQLFIDDARYFARGGDEYDEYWTDNLGHRISDFYGHENQPFSTRVSLYEAGEGIYSLEIRKGGSHPFVDIYYGPASSKEEVDLLLQKIDLLWQKLKK